MSQTQNESNRDWAHGDGYLNPLDLWISWKFPLQEAPQSHKLRKQVFFSIANPFLVLVKEV